MIDGSKFLARLFRRREVRSLSGAAFEFLGGDDMPVQPRAEPRDFYLSRDPGTGGTLLCC